ncbi:Invasion protein InvF [Pseudomonas fluorescens]|uniref:helix-turn-helix domain-containing protein n=1 Tax=Pseudomonas fluorescens TaxID=294 RepID=UPI0012417ECA|nr:AraC family transcriptional regulator [Pseudomonas fluorescens]VVP32263.1 Invasion protein InvF [Pseudomonas fluorescens]
MHAETGHTHSRTLQDWCAEAKPFDLVVRILNTQQPLCLAHAEHMEQCCLPAGWHGLIAARPGLRVLSGSADILPLSELSLVKLQFFIDQGFPPKRGGRALPLVAAMREPAGGALDTARSLETWFIAQALQNGSDYQRFAEVLRAGEGYHLLGFLLEKGSSSAKLNDLASHYGVSVSHFRRLCHQALGCAAKPELREWRTAQALLTLVERAQSLTDVAMEYGYASSSHFSKDIRELVGVTPSSLIDINRP